VAVKRLLALLVRNELFFEELYTFGLPVVFLAFAAGAGGWRSAVFMFAMMYCGYGVGSHVMQQRYEKICTEYQRLIEKSQQKADAALAQAQELRRQNARNRD
jgi:hypothetical protein